MDSLRRREASAADAEEVVQDAFLSAIRARLFIRKRLAESPLAEQSRRTSQASCQSQRGG